MNAGIPVVNLNGTEAEALIEQRMDVAAAIERAIKLLREMTPHGRDFQTAPPGSHRVAMAAHRTRCLALERVRDELQNEALAIDKQGKRT